MKMNVFLTAAALSMTLGAAVGAQAQTGRPVHEGPSVSIPAGELKYVPTGVKNEGLELQAAPAWHNFATGPHGSFIKMPSGYASVPHTHTDDYYAVVVKGVMANHAVDAKDVALPVGSYWFQKGEEAHVTKCLSKEECLFFVVQPGKFDFVPAPQAAH